MDKKQFDKLRLTTKMNEMVHIIRTTPYKSQKVQASENLTSLQEEFKDKFGEYSAAHVIKEDVNEASTVHKFSNNIRFMEDGYEDVYLNAEDVAQFILKNLDSPDLIQLDNDKMNEFRDFLIELTRG